jgi:SAM-dependent methyltransferase
MHREAFYASGKSEVDQFELTLARAGVDQAPRGACLELGCGVGRVTGELARLYQQVIAVDISSAHLKVTEEHLRNQQVGNVRLHHLSEPAAVETIPVYDAIYSRIVLQHNSPPVMAWLLEKLLTRLNPGGIAYFQIPTYRLGYRFDVAEYLTTPNTTQMELHFLPQPELFRILARSGCQLLEIREDDAIGLTAATLSNTVLVRKMTSTLTH